MISPEVGEPYDKYYDRVRLAKSLADWREEPEPEVAPWYWRQPPKEQRSPVRDLKALQTLAKSVDPFVSSEAQRQLAAAEARGRRAVEQAAAKAVDMTRQPIRTINPVPNSVPSSVPDSVDYLFKTAAKAERKAAKQAILAPLNKMAKQVRTARKATAKATVRSQMRRDRKLMKLRAKALAL